MVYLGSQVTKNNFTLQLCNNDIKQVSCSKYLDVYVDDQLKDGYRQRNVRQFLQSAH